MDVKLDAAQMNAIVSKAILDSMTPETREGLISNAIASLLNERKSNGYGQRDKTELQMIFDSAARECAHKIIREGMEADADFRQKIEGVFRDAVAKAFDGESRDTMVAKLAENLVNGLKLDRY